MHKRISTIAVLALMAIPLSASAATLDELKAQLQQVLQQLSVASGSSANYCPQLSTTLYRGLRDGGTNGQVSELQKFLSAYYKIPGSDIVTGFFGQATEKHVARLQIENGIEPAQGIVGPLTRALIARLCAPSSPPTTTTNPAPQNQTPIPIPVTTNTAVTTGSANTTTGSVTFTANPKVGVAPLAVKFEASLISGSVDLSKVVVDFGDGATGSIGTGITSHTYGTPGAFAATITLEGKTLGGAIVLVSPTAIVSNDVVLPDLSALIKNYNNSGTTNSTGNTNSADLFGNSDLNKFFAVVNLPQIIPGLGSSGGKSCKTPWGNKVVQDGQSIAFQPWFSQGEFSLAAILPHMQCRNGEWKTCVIGELVCVPSFVNYLPPSLWGNSSPSTPPPPPPPPSGTASGAFAGTTPLGGYAPLSVNFVLYGFTAPSLYPGIPFTLYFGDGQMCGVKNNVNPCGSFTHVYQLPGTYKPYTTFDSGYKDQTATVIVSTSTSASL